MFALPGLRESPTWLVVGQISDWLTAQVRPISSALPCSRHALREWALSDLACMDTTRNASGNKGVLHTLEAGCPEAQVDNLCAKRICPEGEIVGITRLVSDPSPEAILPVRCMVRIKKRFRPSGACLESRRCCPQGQEAVTLELRLSESGRVQAEPSGLRLLEFIKQGQSHF